VSSATSRIKGDAAGGQGTVTFQTGNVGDLIVVSGGIYGQNAHAVTAIGGAHINNMADTGNGTIFDSSMSNAGGVNGVSIFQWSGIVDDVQNLPITVSWSGSLTPNYNFMVQEFTCAGLTGSTLWTVDKHGRSSNISSTVTYPSLTLSGTATPVIAAGLDITSSAPSAGSTPGYVYQGFAADDQLMLSNINITAVTQPTHPVGLSLYETMLGLFYATNPTATTNGSTLTLQPCPTGRMWLISQITFEFVPTTSQTGMLVAVTLNGRIVRNNIDPLGSTPGFQGPPYITVRAGDTMTAIFTGVPIGTTAVANFLYNEYSAYATPSDLGGVV
jgi:hypothetical protein